MTPRGRRRLSRSEPTFRRGDDDEREREGDHPGRLRARGPRGRRAGGPRLLLDRVPALRGAGPQVRGGGRPVRRPGPLPEDLPAGEPRPGDQAGRHREPDADLLQGGPGGRGAARRRGHQADRHQGAGRVDAVVTGAGDLGRTTMAERYDLIVVGAGPAGLSAAIYAARARLKTLVLDESVPGGQVKTTHKVSNYPGFPEDVKGADLAKAFAAQAERFGARIRRAVEITKHDLASVPKKLELDEEEQVETPAVIVATGAKPRELGVPGESKFKGRGISYCATCDGAYFDDKEIHVIGGGNSAVEESLFLTQFAKKVTIIHQFDHFQAEPVSAAEALAHPKIEVVWNSEPRAFLGEGQLERVRIENVKTKETRELSTD